MDTGLTGQATAQHVSAGRSPFRERMRRFTQWSRRHPRIAWVTGATVAGLALFLCFLRLSWTYPAGSDGADQALQAWDVLHGNLLLHGWTIADVTYYTTEIPQYMLIELIRGLGPDVEHIAAACTYTLLLLAAGLLARGRSTGREGLIRFAVAAGIMIAPQFGNATHLLLSQPDHLGTQLPLLLAFLLLDRAPRRWYVPVAFGAILTLVVIADQIAMLTAAVPIAIVCGARALLGVVRHRKSAGLPVVRAFPGRGRCLVVRRGQARRAADHPPAWIPPPPASDETHPDRLSRAAHRADGGGNPQRFRRRLPPPLEKFPARSQPGRPADGRRNRPRRGAPGRRGAGGVGLLPRVPVLLRPQRPGLPVLATAIVVNVAAYVLSIVPVTLFDTREIVAVLPFGAVLAGRMVPGTLTGLPRRLKPALAWVSVGVLACYMAGLGYGTAHRPVADFDQAIVPWLEAHHLTTGLGTYFEANLITMDSGGRVAVRTVLWQFTRDVPRRYESKADWYDPRQSYANFIVTNTADDTQNPDGSPRRNSLIPLPAIAALHAGPPAHVYHYKTFTIMVWNHNLLDDLGSTLSTLPGEIPCHVQCT